MLITSKLQALYRLTAFLLLVSFSNTVLGKVSLFELSGLKITSNETGVQINLDSIQVGDNSPIESIAYHCPKELTVYPQHTCQSSILAFKYNKQSYLTNLNSQFDFKNNNWKVSLNSVNQDFQVVASSSDPSITLEFKDMILSQLLQDLNQSTSITQLPEVLLNGLIEFNSELLTLTTPSQINFSGLNYEYSDDVIVADLNGTLSFTYDINSEKFEYDLKLNGGEMLLNELYVDFSAYPLISNGEVLPQVNGWNRVNSNWKNHQSLSLKTSFEFNPDYQWQNLQFSAHVIDAFHFNQNILSSVLGIYGFGGTEMSGQFTVNAISNENTLDEWQVEFNDYFVLNEGRKIVAESLTGVLNWKEMGKANDSSLQWQLLSLAGLPINPAKAEFNLSADTFHLIGAHKFPVFDGQIEINQWNMSSLFSESLNMSLNANLLPISLKLITEKLGWPSMAGKISGTIPGMEKNGQVIEFQGALNLDVFNGSMLINNLSMERLFGVAPVIAGDIEFDGFDLSLLTETFGFGLITGKLHGEIEGLRITNWKTDRLDAQVYTVKTKGIKQTISQRAIDNISSLGGIQGAISKTFLRFFDDFRYSKIKLSCKLHNSVCEIGGIKNKNNQFTIVEGGGIPNINIVGFVRSIDWDDFISRLLNANYDG